MHIVDSSADMLSAFDAGRFDLSRWKAYMDACVPGAAEKCLVDMKECIRAGYSWEDDYLPVLNAVCGNADLRRKAEASFLSVTGDLERKILDRFGRVPEADIVLYLGLCNGAGWVTEILGKTTVLLGIEKIMELGWCGIDEMNGLIIHELGHVYQSQFGVFRIETDSIQDRFLWQLFTEGTAMVFEQEIIGSPDYYHQDRDGWKAWCDGNAELIRFSFSEDLGRMTPENQRYFGDWVRFEGRGDTGYYLGTRFVRFLMETDDFDRVIRYGTGEVREGFGRFMDSPL